MDRQGLYSFIYVWNLEKLVYESSKEDDAYQSLVVSTVKEGGTDDKEYKILGRWEA